MKTVYPEFAEEVNFYAVGYDPSEGISKLDSFAQSNGYPWPVAVAQGNIVRDLNVAQQSYKVAFDGQGVQVYRASYGDGSAEDWRRVFTELAGR
jgi:hypothetical protein